MRMSSGDAADEVVRMMLRGAELTLRLTASASLLASCKTTPFLIFRLYKY